MVHQCCLSGCSKMTEDTDYNLIHCTKPSPTLKLYSGGYYVVITWLLHGYVITWLLHGYYMVITWLLHGHKKLLVAHMIFSAVEPSVL